MLRYERNVLAQIINDIILKKKKNRQHFQDKNIGGIMVKIAKFYDN